MEGFTRRSLGRNCSDRQSARRARQPTTLNHKYQTKGADCGYAEAKSNGLECGFPYRPVSIRQNANSIPATLPPKPTSGDNFRDQRTGRRFGS